LLHLGKPNIDLAKPNIDLWGKGGKRARRERERGGAESFTFSRVGRRRGKPGLDNAIMSWGRGRLDCYRLLGSSLGWGNVHCTYKSQTVGSMIHPRRSFSQVLLPLISQGGLRIQMVAIVVNAVLIKRTLRCKKRLLIFPSPAGMSLTKLSPVENNLINSD
jgi:hypothetical protein